MRFCKYLLVFILSFVLVEASDYYSPSTGEETSKRVVSKASTVVHSHDALQTTMKSEGRKYGYEDKDHDKTKTTHGNTALLMTRSLTPPNRMVANNVLAETTKTHHDHTKTYSEHSKAMHTDSSHSTHEHKMHHNSTNSTNDYMTYLKTYTTASTTMTSASYNYESYTTAIYSEESYLAAAAAVTESTSSEMTFDIFTTDSCTGCIMDATVTEAFESGLTTASVLAQDFTMSLPVSYVATPPYYTQSTLATSAPYMVASAPSAGFATTSLAVFTGTGGRRGVDYLLVAVLPALVGMGLWV
jgi:hypothetical protein